MQTQEVGIAKPNPVVRLKSGALVSQALVKRVVEMMDGENGALLFNDLVMRCQDEFGSEEMRFVYFDGSISRLGTLGFLQPDGNVYPTFREIALDLAR